MRKIQSRVVSAANQIRALSSEGHSWLHVNYIGLQAATTLSRKIGLDIVGSDDMTTLEIAALLGEDEVIARLLSNGEAITGRKVQIDALRCACIGGNLSSLKFLLDYGADLSLCGKKDITALHLMIYMPVDLVQRAVSLLIAYGAPTNVCSKATRLTKTTFELVGTPIEWAVIARNRGLVAALLPHSKGQERKVLGHAISYAYYEIAEDLLSNGALSSGLVSEADCPILNYSQAFTHLFIHGRDGDIAIERTIRLCDAHNLINYNTMLRHCIVCARTQSCLKALEVLLDLCPPSIIRQGFESDVRDEVLMSNLYIALGQARANTAWKPVLEAILRNFSVAELEVKELKEPESADIYRRENVLFTAVIAGWTTGVQVLLEKGVDRYQKIDERTTYSIFDIAAQTGDIEMQAILSRYGEENENSLKKSMAHEYPSWWFSLHKDMAREKFNAHVNKNPGKKDSSTRYVLSKAHEVLKQLLVLRDIYFSEHRVAAKFPNFENLLWDTFLALISNESMAGYIDTPDEKDVTMLQRAASFLDLDVIRLLLEAGADANVPFLVKERASDDGNDLVVPFLPFQIAIWVSRTTSWLFARGTMGVAKTQDAIPSKQAVVEPTIKPRFLHRFAHFISHAAEKGAKRIKGLTSGPTLTPGEKTAESLRNSSLRAAQELLQWHLLRNDRRFEGITEFHISSSMKYASHTITLARRNPKIADVKASWPGLEGKYTGQELAKMPWKDEWSVFTVGFRRLRGVRTRLA
jgi:ankyrin repeat protein